MHKDGMDLGWSLHLDMKSMYRLNVSGLACAKSDKYIVYTKQCIRKIKNSRLLKRSVFQEQWDGNNSEPFSNNSVPFSKTIEVLMSLSYSDYH